MMKLVLFSQIVSFPKMMSVCKMERRKRSGYVILLHDTKMKQGNSDL